MKRKISLFFLLLLALSTTAQVGPEKNVRMMSTGRVIHRFFDSSPISPSGKYLAVFRFPYENHSPIPGDAGEVVLINMKTGKEKVIAKSRGWEFQLGAQVQWGASDKELYFNDVDTLSWTAHAVCLNPFTGQARKLGGTVFMVSPDGKKLASYDLVKSIYAQVGYGVIIPKNKNPKVYGLKDNEGVTVTDVATGITKQIVSVREIYEKTTPSIAIPNPEDQEYYCFQVKWNPQGTRLLTTLQWTPKNGGNKLRSVITMRPDGSDLHTAITPQQWAKGGHHVNWTADGEHLSMNLNVDGKPGLEIIEVKYDGTDMKTIYTPGSGHPSFHPTLPLMVTDAYAGEMPTAEGKAPIRLIDIEKGREQTVASVFLPPIKDFEFRVDEHPAWDRAGRYVVFNGYVNGTRSVFVVDLKKQLKNRNK